MRPKIILFILLVISNYTFAQSKPAYKEPDSIRRVFVAQNDFQSALPYAIQAADLARKENVHDTIFVDVLDGLFLLYYQLGDIKNAIVIAEELKNWEKKMRGEDHAQYAVALNNLAALYSAIGQMDEALPLYKEALKIEERELGKDDYNYALSQNNVAELYKRMGNFAEADALYKEAINTCERALGKENLNYATMLNNQAEFFVARGQFASAEPMHKEVLRIRKKVLGEMHPDYAQSLNNLALVHKKLKHYVDAQKYYEAALLVIKNTLGMSHPDYAQSLNNLGVLYIETKNYKDAGILFQEVLRICEKSFGKQDVYVAKTLSNMAKLEFEQGQLDQAEKLFGDAAAIFKEKLGGNHPQYAEALNALAKVALLKKNDDQAIDFALNALYANGKEGLGKKSDLVAQISKIGKEASFIEYNTALFSFYWLAKAFHAKYEKVHDVASLKSCYQILNALSDCSGRYQRTLYNQQDLLLSISNNNLYNTLTLKSIKDLTQATSDDSYYNNAIYFIEKNKSQLLLSTLQSETALLYGGIPDSLKQQEHKIRTALSKLDKLFTDARFEGDTIKAQKINQKLLQYRVEEQALAQTLEKNYPKYYQMKYKDDVINAKTIQEKLLSEKDALIEYFIHDSVAFAIVITKKIVHLVNIPYKEEELRADVHAFRKSLSDYKFITSSSNRAFGQFVSYSNKLYNKLFAPFRNHLEGISHLIIVPDGYLGHIPFEVLLSESQANTEESYKELHYLLKDYSISYSYSSTLLLENKMQERSKSPKGLLSFGAQYPKHSATESSANKSRGTRHKALREALGELPAVKNEVNMLKEILGGDSYYGDLANERNFKAIAGDYQVIHLAMHGLLDAQYPLRSSLAFTENADSLEDNFLEVHEISNMHLNADLVVLSACETGLGKFEQGEGIMSLARSFMYAGVPAVVVSLWSVNDNSTARLMELYYDQLADGLRKSDAMRNAKLKYLATAQGITAHPAFWSPFIQLGDDAPVGLHHKSSYWIWVLGALGVVLAGGGLVWWRKKKEVA